MRLRISLFESFMKQEMAWFDESENSVGSLCAILAGESAGVQAVRDQFCLFWQTFVCLRHLEYA